MAKEFVKGVTVGEATAEENTQPAVSTVETNEEETKQVIRANHKPVEKSDFPSRSGPGSQYRSERHDRDIQGLRGRNVTGPGYKRSHQHRACQTDE